MKDFKKVIAIDISKAKLDVCIADNVQLVDHHYFKCKNELGGFKRILAKIRNLKWQSKEAVFVFEHTGVYGIKLATFLQSKGLCYSMVPGIEIKRSVGISRSKTDKIDCKQIAQYAFSNAHKLKATSLPDDALQRIKLLLAERDKLVDAIKSFGMTKETKACYPMKLFKDVDVINQRTIKYLKKQLKAIEAKLNSLIKAENEIKEQFKLATSVTGVGPQTAIHLIVATNCFSLFPDWRKLACYTGIAPMPYESGSSIKGRRKVNHLANKKLKSLLNMAALSAKRFDPEMKKYYEKKKAEGKHSMVIMNAIRCKVLSRIFATVKRGTPYVNTSKFIAA